MNRRGDGRDLSDESILARQYADDTNLAARQRLWQISRSEPELDFNAWSVALLGAHPQDRVLDAGCGNGRPFALLRERGCDVVGLDRSYGMARPLAPAPVCVADVQALPFGDSTFDAAAALMMLYHVPDRPAAAAELRRVVRPGGVLVATTAAADNQPELRDIVEAAVGSGWRWSRPSASQFELEAGTEILGTAFESVEVVRAPERRISITDADAMAAYLASTADHYEHGLPTGVRWDDVVETVRSATARTVADDGAFVVTARLGALVCR